MKPSVYVITNLTNGKVYVGKSVRPHARWERHRYDAKTGKTPLCRAMRKHGIESFRFEIVEECASEAESFDAEQRWVAKLNSMLDGNGYNQTAGGAGVPRPFPDQRERMGRGRRGIPQSPEHIAKRAAANRGKKRSPEVCERLRALRFNPSEETRAKMSAAKKGRAQSAEAVAKRAESTRANGKKAAKMAAIRAAHAERLTSIQIAARVGCTDTLVCRYLREMGLEAWGRQGRDWA